MKHTQLTLVSWNINGARAVYKKGFLAWLAQARPDLVGLQETRAQASELPPDLAQPEGYTGYWNPSREKRGYSGTALLTKLEPLRVEYGLGSDQFDGEGRTLIAYYPTFVLLNCYFPNGGRDLSRVPFKMEFCDAFLAKCEQLRQQGQAVIFCGDVNTAHKPIDLAHPKENEKNTGFLPVERAWMDKLVEAGYVDTFRHFHPDLAGQYTWWSMVTQSRKKNVGWRIDYFFVTREVMERITDAFILPDVPGSDHCPVGIRLKL